MPVASLSYILDLKSWATMLLGCRCVSLDRLIEDALGIDLELCKHPERKLG
jgi:hypothetical protein